MKSGTKGFIGGLVTAGIVGIVSYFGYKMVKPDYLKDYEEDDDFDDTDDLDDFDDFDGIDDLDDEPENIIQEVTDQDVQDFLNK